MLSNDFWNPYDFVWVGDSWLVADAGRNTLARLSSDGAVSQLFAIPDLAHRRDELRRLSPTEFKGGESYLVDAVPTASPRRRGIRASSRSSRRNCPGCVFQSICCPRPKRWNPLHRWTRSATA